MSQLQFSNEEFPKEFVRDALKDVRHPFEVAVYGLGNYFNLATVIRTAHNFLSRKIYVIDGDGFYKKGTMGNHRFEDIEKTTLEEFIQNTQGRNIVPFERRPGWTTLDIRNYRYPENPILLFGSEKDGIHDDLIEFAGRDNVVAIPGYGVNNDLNVGVAASIVMYDWIAKNTHFID